MIIHSSPWKKMRALRQSLLAGAALGGALLAAAAPEAAHAQAINATPTVVGGGAIIDRSVPGRDTVTIDTNSAIITWTPPNPPLPDPYIFLPQGTVVTFQNGASNSDFAVLNRILTNVPSRFEGSVISQLIGSGGSTTPGGTVFFSSPGGIVIGSTASFDVGNLVLTSLNVVDDGTPSGIFIGAGGRYFLNDGGLAPNAGVVVESGAQILANGPNSYVALIAPRVVQGGNVFVDGSTAYIAGEEVQFSVNQGLFDIVVTAGSDNANPIIHTGSTGGPSSSAVGDNHNIYAVAVARNQAITMLLQGSMGYEAATVAGVENGAIVLSAGYNVTAGLIDPTPVPGPAADLAISDGQFTSDVTGRATGNATATATIADPLSFDGSLTLDAVGAVVLADGAGADINVGEDVILSGATIDIDSLVAGGFISTNSTGATTIGNAGSGGAILVLAGGPADLGTLDSGSNLTVDAAGITLASGTATDDVTLTSPGNIDVAFAQAGDDFRASAGGSFNGANVVTTGLGDDTEDVGGASEGSNIFVDASGDLRLDNGTATDAIRLNSSTASVLSAAQLTAGTELELRAAVDIDIEDAGAGADIITNSGAATSMDAVSAGDDFSADAGGAFAAGTVLAGLGPDNDGPSGALPGGNIVVNAGAVRLDNGDAPDEIRLNAFFGDLVGTLWNAGSDLTGFAGGAIDLGNANAGGALDLRAGGNLDADTLTAGTSLLSSANGDTRIGFADSGGALSVFGGGAGDIGTLQAATDIVIDLFTYTVDSATAGRDIDLFSQGGPITVGFARAGDDFQVRNSASFTGGSVIAGGGPDSEADGANIVINADGNLRLDNGTAPGLIDLSAAAGSIFSNGTLTANQLIADAALNLSLGRVFVAQPLILSTANGNISGTSFNSDGDISLDASGTINLAGADSGGSITLLGGGDVRLDQGTAVAAITLTSSDGSVLSGDRLDGGGGGDGLGSGPIGLLTAGTDILATAAVDIFLEDAQAGDSIVLNAGRDTGVRDLIAADSVDVQAVGTAGFDEDVAAPTIAVASSDIAIAAGATLGNAATQLVSLTVAPPQGLPGQQTVLGGAAQGPGYTLTDAEAGRITAAILRIQAPATGTAADRAADVLVRDLSLSGQAIGLFDLRTPGIVQVEGNLLLAGVQPDGGIEIRATERIQLVNPAGSIRVQDGTGLTDGNLLLFSNNIWSATQGLLDQLRADPDFAGRDEALLANDGGVEPRGHIEAGDVVLSARDTLFVQNSGGQFDFAGITVRENTLRIVPNGTQPLKVFAFGRRINPDGSFVTNIDFFNEVEFQGRGGPVGFTDDAQFNLCFINTGACRLPDGGGGPLPGGSDIIEEPVDGTFTVTLPSTGDDLVDTSFADEPLIEEPVTSGSDSILWDCDRDEDGDCDEDDTNG